MTSYISFGLRNSTRDCARCDSCMLIARFTIAPIKWCLVYSSHKLISICVINFIISLCLIMLISNNFFFWGQLVTKIWCDRVKLLPRGSKQLLSLPSARAPTSTMADGLLDFFCMYIFSIFLCRYMRIAALMVGFMG